MKSKIRDEELAKFELSLFKACQNKNNFVPEEAWQQNVMREIRKTGVINKTRYDMDPEESAVFWKFAGFCMSLSFVVVAWQFLSSGILTTTVFLESFFYNDFTTMFRDRLI